MIHPRRIWRKSIGATLAAVAAEVGVSEGLVQRWEVGTRVPTALMDASWLSALRRLDLRSRESVSRLRGEL